MEIKEAGSKDFKILGITFDAAPLALSTTIFKPSKVSLNIFF